MVGVLKVGFLLLLMTAWPAAAGCRDEIEAAQAKQVLIEKCGVCHRGPFLDMSQYPFYSSMFPTESELFAEFARRLQLETFGVMPPVNGKPLTAQEKDLVLAWLSQVTGE